MIILSLKFGMSWYVLIEFMVLFRFVKFLYIGIIMFKRLVLVGLLKFNLFIYYYLRILIFICLYIVLLWSVILRLNLDGKIMLNVCSMGDKC